MTDWPGLGGPAGARVVVVDRDQGRLQSLGIEAKEAGSEIGTSRIDVASREGSRAAVMEASEAVGDPHIFLHAVGRTDRRPVLELADEDRESILTLNLPTAWWLGQEVGRRMVAAGYGRMIFVSSVSALLARASHAPYAATKGGINQMQRVMAREWATSDVTVNAVAPWYIETDLTREHLDVHGHHEGRESLIPAGRLGRSREVAEVVTLLASDRASFITGQNIYVDGGRTLV
jgi:gluconate 5-dehydrogenase